MSANKFAMPKRSCSIASGEQANVRLSPSEVATLIRIDGCNTRAMPSLAIATSVRQATSTNDGNEAHRCSAAATRVARLFLITAQISTTKGSGIRSSSKSLETLSVDVCVSEKCKKGKQSKRNRNRGLRDCSSQQLLFSEIRNRGKLC